MLQAIADHRARTQPLRIRQLTVSLCAAGVCIIIDAGKKARVQAVN
jgi:hypothetical protein